MYTKKYGDAINYSDIETNFETAKENNSDIIGYRFISSIDNTNIGTINYITSITSNPDVDVVKGDISEEVYIQKPKPKWILTTGLVLLVMGLAVVAYAFMKKNN